MCHWNQMTQSEANWNTMKQQIENEWMAPSEIKQYQLKQSDWIKWNNVKSSDTTWNHPHEPTCNQMKPSAHEVQ